MTVQPFIEAEKQSNHNVKRACELLKVSRTAFYARRNGIPVPRAVRDLELAEKIAEAHEYSRGTYGAPRVHAVLQREGERCGRRRVARLMRDAGLQGRHRRRRHLTTVPDPRAATRPDLIGRDFAPDPAALDVRWCGDITYIPTDQGWLYRPPSSTSRPAVSSAGQPPIICGPTWSPTLSRPPVGGAAPPVR
ncbi:IS3 family transposase [Streptomyces sp. NPDC051366]|uniref:IS3 family transposase n=1 Tax=Streptomyces sp. NPDC051366 TaxID=3365652 RepID=UPI0037B0B843